VKVHFLVQAEKELDSGIEYYQIQKPGLGIQFLKEVRSAIERIKLYPEAWQPLSKRTRRCQTKRFPYAVIYQVRSDEILIVAIAHLHQSPDYWRKRVIQK
jgi:hypothetical protein